MADENNSLAYYGSLNERTSEFIMENNEETNEENVQDDEPHKRQQVCPKMNI